MDLDGAVSIAASDASRFYQWEEIQSSFLSNISSADTLETLESALHALFQLGDCHLCSFLCSKEGISLIKSNIITENSTLRPLFISSFGCLVVRGWILLHDCIDLEGFVKVDSRAEARRNREDFIDMAIDLFKKFAFGCIGKATGSDPSQVLEDNVQAMDTYCDAVAYLFATYNDSPSQLDAWVDALLGVRGSSSARIASQSRRYNNQQRLSLLPLLRPAANIVFSDPYEMVTRCSVCGDYSNKCFALITQFCHLLMSELGREGSQYVLLDLTSTKSYLPLFAAGNSSELTPRSLSSDLPVCVVQFVTEWIHNHLLYAFTDGLIDPSEMYGAGRELITLCQHKLLVKCREKISEAVLHRLYYLLETDFTLLYGESVDTVIHRSDLICFALLTMRYLSDHSNHTGDDGDDDARDFQGDLLQHALRMLRIILVQVSDNVSQTRLLAELAALLVEASVTAIPVDESSSGVSKDNENENGTSPKKSISYDFSKTSLGQLLLLHLQDKDSALRHPRFIGALLRTLRNSTKGSVNLLLQHLAATGAVNNVVKTNRIAECHSSSGILPVRGSHAPSPSVTVSQTAGNTCDLLMRQLQGALFITKLCGESYLRWPVVGEAGDLVPRCFVALLETAAAVLFAQGGHGTGSVVRQYLVEHGHEQTVSMFAQALAATLDKLVDTLTTNNGKALVTLCSYQHAMRFSALCVRFLRPIKDVTSKDLGQPLLAYLRLLLKQSSGKRKHYVAELQAWSEEGLLGGGKAFNSMIRGQPEEANPDQDALTMHHRMCSLSLLVELASAAPETLPACVTLAREIENILCVSSATLSTPEHQGIISVAVMLREHVETVIRQLTALLHTHNGAISVSDNVPTSSSAQVIAAVTGVAEDHAKRLSYEKLLNINASLLYEDCTSLAHNQNVPSAGHLAEHDLFGGFAPSVSNTANNIAPSQTSSSLLDLFSHPITASNTTAAAGSTPNTFVAAENTSNLTAPFTAPLYEPLFFPVGDLADRSKEYGMFSATNRNITRRGGDDTQQYACSSDPIALIDDVLQGHPQLSHSTDKTQITESTSAATYNSNSAMWSDALSVASCPSSAERLNFSQLSGACDVLTVLAAATVDVLTCTVAVHVRVHNSSGFKIPIFSLQLMTTGNGPQTALFDKDAIFRATGMEYFLPDAYVERTFTISVSGVAALSLVIRVIYPDLSCDGDEDLFEVPAEDTSRGQTAGKRSSTRAPRGAFTTAVAGSYFDGYSLTDTGHNSGKSTAIIDCCPLHVPVAAFLVPYGGGSLSAMRYYVSEVAGCNFESRVGGISQSVFESLWARLAGSSHGEVIVRVGGCYDCGSSGVLRSEAVSAGITSSIARTLSVDSSSNMHLLGSDGRVRGPCCIAWCHQTLWGCDVACQLTIDGGDVSSKLDNTSNNRTCWIGTLTVRCSDLSTLKAIRNDMAHYIFAISGGGVVQQI